MTQHLSTEELVDLVEDREGLLSAGRAAHVKSCQSCRQQVQELRSVMLEAGGLTVPEPSPLFWEHASKRLSGAVTADARSHRGRWWERLSLGHVTAAVTTATVVLAVVLGLPFVRALSERPTVGRIDPANDVAGRPVAAGQTENISVDESADWALLLTMADAVEWADGEAELFMGDRRAITGAVFELTSDERQALAQLLEAELESGL